MTATSTTLSYLGPLCAFLSAVCWAIGSAAYSSLSARLPAYMVNFTRAAVALPFFVALAVFLPSAGHGFAAMNSARAWWLLLSVISSFALGDMLFLWSTHSLGIPGALAISSSYPIWSALGGWLFKGETLTPLNMGGLMLIVGGSICVILAGRDRGAPKASEPGGWLGRYPVGVALAFMASLFWGLNAFSVAVGSDGLSVGVANTVRMTIAVLLCPLLGYATLRLTTKAPTKVFHRVPLKSFLWVFVLEGFGGACFNVYGLTHSPLATGAALSSLAPAISAPVAVAMGLERFSLWRSMGVVLVVVGIWLLVAPA